MSDETTIPAAGAPAPAAAGSDPGDPTVAFCQQCGRPLSAATRHQVSSGVFCAPCAAARVAPSSDWRPVGTGPAGPYGSTSTNANFPGSAPSGARRSGPGNAGEPNPVLAGFLGLIPGVGAMYNGQYPKGAIHLIVFVVLVSLADNLNWVFWWFVWGWIFYQGFDAYHTALARRDGRPLPDPFGWNELGERMGMGRSWPPATNAGFAPGPAPSSANNRPVPPPFTPDPFPAAANEAAAPLAPFPSHSGTYAPPVDMPLPPPPVSYASVSVPPYAPYAETYTGVSTHPPSAVPANSRRFPVGAAWLIGLGVLFLLGNLLPSWQLEGRWLVPILLGALAVWIGIQRTIALRAAAAANDGGTAWPPINRLAGTLLGPALLAAVAILLALQAGNILPLRHSWPALLIVWGGLQLLERVPAAVQIDADPLSAEGVNRPTAGRP